VHFPGRQGAEKGGNAVKLLGCSLLTVAIVLLADDSDANKKDLQKMQGDWGAVELARDGNRLEPVDAQAYFRTVEGGTYTMTRYRKALGKGTFKIDASKNPREIDAHTNAKGKNVVVKGIYEWDGDKLRIMFGPADGARPTSFKLPPPGTPGSYTLWEREVKE
jgi:uncharacterized protein (TIGR03067 family)